MLWPEDRFERASVSSFGIGGSNAHVILDSAASYGVDGTNRTLIEGSKPNLLLLTANHIDSMRNAIINYQDFLETHTEVMDDIAYTLAFHREHLPYRAYAITNGEQPQFSMPVKVLSKPPEVIFVFTGQGAQWATMGVDLISAYPSALRDLCQMDEALSTLGGQAPSWSLYGQLSLSSTPQRYFCLTQTIRGAIKRFPEQQNQ